MADSSVAVTAGSGTSIDTRTEATNGNHRPVYVIGDPSVNNAVATVTDPGSGAYAGLVVFSDAPPSSTWSYAAANLGIVNTTTAVTIKTAAGAGIRNYLTSVDIMAEALGTATEVAIRDGAAGTVLWRTKIGTGGLTGGRSIRFHPALRGTANTLLEVVTLTSSGTGAVYVNAQGYVSA